MQGTIRHFHTVSLTFLSKLVRYGIMAPFTGKKIEALNGKVTWPRSHEA